MRDTVLIEEMTWPEVREAIASGKRRVIVMLATMEQHGPHLPIGTDTYLGYATGVRLARRLGDALVAPVVTIGYSACEGFTGDASILWRSKVPPPMDTMSPTGILGDARGSTAALGEKMFAERIERLAKMIEAGELAR